MNAPTLSSRQTAEESAACSHCAACIQLAPVDPFPLSGNVALPQVLTFLHVAHATAYKYNMVPMYDDNGHRIETDNVPPFPLLPLPDVTTLKPIKMWDAAEIRELHVRIRQRMRSRIAGNDPIDAHTSSTTSTNRVEPLKTEVHHEHP